MRRLGSGKRKSSREKWSQRKKTAKLKANGEGSKDGGTSEESKDEGSSEGSKDEGTSEGSKDEGTSEGSNLDRLTSLADILLANGEHDVYESTYEGIKFRIEQEVDKAGKFPE